MNNVRKFLPLIRFTKCWGFYGFCHEFFWENQSSRKSVFLCIKNSTFSGMAKPKPHLVLRLPQTSIIHIPPSVKSSKKKYLSFIPKVSSFEQVLFRRSLQPEVPPTICARWALPSFYVHLCIRLNAHTFQEREMTESSDRDGEGDALIISLERYTDHRSQKWKSF